MTEHPHDPARTRSGPLPAQAHCPPLPDDPERLAMLDGLKHQIRQGVYQPDIRDLARSLATMIVRDL